MTTTDKKTYTVQEAWVVALALTVIDVVKSAGSMGAPGGHIYNALSAHGVTFDQYNGLMAGLVQAGRIEKRGQCYHAKVLTL